MIEKLGSLSLSLIFGPSREQVSIMAFPSRGENLDELNGVR